HGQTARGYEGVRNRNFERVHEPTEGTSSELGCADPRRAEVELPVARRRGPLLLTGDAREHPCAVALRHEVDHPLDLVRSGDTDPVGVLCRVRHSTDSL